MFSVHMSFRKTHVKRREYFVYQFFLVLKHVILQGAKCILYFKFAYCIIRSHILYLQFCNFGFAILERGDICEGQRRLSHDWSSRKVTLSLPPPHSQIFYSLHFIWGNSLFFIMFYYPWFEETLMFQVLCTSFLCYLLILNVFITILCSDIFVFFLKDKLVFFSLQFMNR